MDKYTELIKKLRYLTEEETKDGGYVHVITMEAADAIGELVERNMTQRETIGELLNRGDRIIDEIARRDTTDGTIKVFSGKEVCEIVNRSWKPFPLQYVERE